MKLPPLSDSGSDCVELVDSSGHILWMNKRRQGLLALSGSQISVGSRWLDLWPEAYREGANAALSSASKNGDGRFTAPTSTDAAPTTWWDVAVTAVDDGDNNGRRLSIARDVTSYVASCRDRESLLEQERQARLAIEKDNRNRDYALLVAAHELGAPLYAVRGWAQYLQLGSLEPDECAEAVEAIARNTDRQYHLVERLLEVARFRSKRASMTLLANPIDEIVIDAIECVRPIADSKQIAMQSEIATSARIMADFDQLQRAFSNLLFNSVKFTPSGGAITVRCTEHTDRVRVEFTDTGAGIEPDFIEKAFEPFSQDPATHQSSIIGLGLGLSIVRRIVEGHHGTVQVTSEGRGLGSTFVIDLPAASRTMV